jgi:hypothetical protein
MKVAGQRLPAAAILGRGRDAKKERVMEDFPIWLKVVVWVIVGSTVLYTAAQILRSVLT